MRRTIVCLIGAGFTMGWLWLAPSLQAQLARDAVDADGNRFLTDAGGTIHGSLVVSNGFSVSGPVNLGTNAQLQGAIVLSSNQTTAAAGMLRWNPVSSNFEGYTGSEWVTLGNVYSD